VPNYLGRSRAQVALELGGDVALYPNPVLFYHSDSFEVARKDRVLSYLVKPLSDQIMRAFREQ